MKGKGSKLSDDGQMLFHFGGGRVPPLRRKPTAEHPDDGTGKVLSFQEAYNKRQQELRQESYSRISQQAEHLG